MRRDFPLGGRDDWSSDWLGGRAVQLRQGGSQQQREGAGDQMARRFVGAFGVCCRSAGILPAQRRGKWCAGVSAISIVAAGERVKRNEMEVEEEAETSTWGFGLDSGGKRGR